MNAVHTPVRTKALSCALLLLLAAPPLASGRTQGDAATGDLQKTRSMAEAQHEIVMLLIRKKKFDQAAAEANKIFQMRWPVDQEPVLLKELLFLSGQFFREGQTKTAIQLLETNVRHFRTAPSQVAILKEKGYLYKHLKEDDKALDCFREAQRLEKNIN